MKISEMNNDQATEALIRIATPFENICNDEEVIDSLDKIGKLRDTSIIKAIGYIIPVFTNVGLKKHKHDLYEIVAALTMTYVGDVGKMNFKETLNALQESYDDILHGFFTHTAIGGKTRRKK